jgi:hypothetical protein
MPRAECGPPWREHVLVKLSIFERLHLEKLLLIMYQIRVTQPMKPWSNNEDWLLLPLVTHNPVISRFPKLVVLLLV